MSQKVRFITIVALGLGVLTGVAATAQTGSTGPATVLTADGAPTTAPTAPGTPAPASTTTPPPPLPTGHQDTWGWG
ncbi:hypothetical protein [Kitasatospora sp. NE20-6]|uniref:hypothetical protein n=1 Tax=Kitasatospora sp. NE20-6 TaxID=2859066 RepID=UPI0038B2AD63